MVGCDNAGRLPQVAAEAIPWVTAEQMRQADALAMGPFGIDLLQMMEHAGAAVAETVRQVAPVGSVVVLAGAGNNGGGGLCAARHLMNQGRDVAIVLSSDHRGEAVEHHLRTLGRMRVVPSTEPPDAPVVVDALVGYGLHGPLTGRAALLAAWTAGRFVVSLDYPSGFGHDGAVEPDATVTLALPKAALRDVRPLFLADLGLPDALWAELGVEAVSVFGRGRLLQVTDASPTS